MPVFAESYQLVTDPVATLIIDEDPAECYFTKQFGPIRGAVAVDGDRSFAGWRIGCLSDMEAEPPNLCEIVDGLVIY